MTIASDVRSALVLALLAFSGTSVDAAVAGAGLVSDERVATDTSGDNWLVKGGSYAQAQFSPLAQINAGNAGRLGLAWLLEVNSPSGLTAEPLVVDGTIYLSAPRSIVYAIDGATGQVRWTYDPKVRLGLSIEGSSAARTSRGVAVWQGKVYVGTGDCRLVAIDAASGVEAWQARVCDAAQAGVTGAPRVARGKVYVGYSGADSHVRGSIAAFDAATGREVWRFWTVPGDPAKGFESRTVEFAAKTWSGPDWWRQGGGTVWDPITYDAATGLLLFGTSKAFLDDTPTGQTALPGAKLFSGSIVAVRADTGEYVWHYQTSTPERQTENFHIVIADLPIGGRTRHVAMSAARNGTYYVLDAATGELLSATPLVRQGFPKALAGWGPEQMDYPGVVLGGAEDCAQGCFGVRNWWPMSYDPRTRLTYIPIMDLRRGPRPPGALPMVGRLVAWDPVARRTRWSVEHPVIVNSGVLSTAGGVVFQGQGTGEFAAYAADTGRQLWSFRTGSAINGTPVTYRAGGEQYVIVPIGWGSIFRLFATASMTSTEESRYGPARLLAFRVGAHLPYPYPAGVETQVPRPPERRPAAAVRRGEELAGTYGCTGCHSPRLEGGGRWVLDGGVPDLRYAPADIHRDWYAILLGGSHREQGMLSFAAPIEKPPTPAMTPAEADDIQAYVIDRAWAAYEAQQRAHR
ncbi:MAG: PQQ-binding-like beta-propeller repeat protein [Proteobacteria bacterium]|nr:PQQ-binding-like beta-propeller repeat protein [Pseudomonadota bacterium]